MDTVYQIKSREVTETPILLFECTLNSGAVERWSTHRVHFDGQEFNARVLRHNLLEFSSAAEDSIDAISRVTITLANADSHFSQIQRGIGFKGAKLTVQFVFADLKSGEPASEGVVLFRGVCDPPDEISEDSIRLSFASRMSLHRVLLPEVRIQRRCPWMFPSSPEQRAEALDGGVRGSHSPFFRCGYSPDQQNGVGSTGPDGPFTTCDYTRSNCVERGMFDKDSSGRETRRFGGIEFVPSTISVKTYGEKGTHLSAAIENESRYNDFVPIVYGTAWYRPPVIFARNDGNLTHTEVLLGMGEVSAVVKVLVNGIELPSGSNAPQATATGWYNLVTQGQRNGAFNADFKAGEGEPAGDPYGSMAVLSVVVPNRISDGASLPRIEVLLDGQVLPAYDNDGASTGKAFTKNPAWILLDLLRRSGWQEEEIDLASFASVAAYCAETIETTDLNGTTVAVPRFQCNLVLRQRRSAADVIRGVRNGSGLYLTYGPGGLLQLHAESSIAIQQPDKAPGSNSTEQLNDGWPCYEFGDGSSPFSDILRSDSGDPSIRLWFRSTADTPNRYTVEFQDEFNEYQQDSLSLVDLEDSVTTGHEVSANLPALGIPNFNQAARIVRAALDRSIRGNTYVEFDSGLRAIGLKPGDLITISYAKEGLERELFRIVRISPNLNYSTARITAQLHNDEWYAGADGLTGGGRQPSLAVGMPRPLVGVLLDEDGESQFEIEESYREKTDGTWDVDLSVSFSPPPKPGTNIPSVPLLSLAALISNSSGALKGGRSYYYAVSGVGADDSESPLSFVVRAAVPSGTDTNEVTLQNLSFAPGTSSFHAYRGLTPTRLLRIASNVPVSPTFSDSGSEATASAPPDQNYHHANFYWRMELQPEYSATIQSETSIGNSGLGMLPDEYRGKIVRITRGHGRGQERSISANDATTLTLASRWDVVPDNTSSFVVAEPGWSFGAVSEGSPVTFAVPNRQNATIHISGRSANIVDRECAYELSPLTRHSIGGAAEDLDVPDAPVFGLTSTGRGSVEIGGIGFTDLHNTRSIAAGSLTLHCWNELAGVSTIELSQPLTADDMTAHITSAVDVQPGVLLQIGNEVLVARRILSDGTEYEVERGAYGSQASAHEAGESVYHLNRRVTILPFAKGFFGTPASGSYSQSIMMPNVRIAVAELFVTNSRGNSQVTGNSYTNTEDGGIRTLSGGQFTLQLGGNLAIQSDAVPPVSVDAPRAVRDVYATVAEAPDGSDIVLRVTSNGSQYCELTIPAGSSVSESIDGRALPPLTPGMSLGLNILSTGLAESGRPGAGLTVTIRV